MIKKAILIIIIILLAAVGAVVFYFFNQISQPASSSTDELIFTVKKGEGVKTIATNLEKKELVKNTLLFRIYVYMDRSQAKFIAGDYLLNKNDNIKQLVKILTSGHVFNERIIKIIEGWTKNEIADYLAKENIVSKEDFLKAADSTDSRQIVFNKTYTFLADKSVNANLEGFLFPDTYRIFKDTISAQIIEKMLDNFDAKLNLELQEAIKAQNHTIFEVVTMASIIEKEVRKDNDRKIAAGIFWKRLENGMALQSDATVNYVTGKQALQPTSEDISVDSLYNTYKYKGLTPGPICNPSLSAIKAAIYPEESDYLYFLTKPDGSTVFSKTYQEHLENKAKYLQ